MASSGLIGNTGEAFKGRSGDDAVQFDENSGLYFVHSEEFVSGYMGKYVMPVRREMASMFLASMIQAHKEVRSSWYREHASDLAATAFAMADGMLLNEADTLKPHLGSYYQAYLGDKDSRDIEKIMTAVMTESQEHHLGGTMRSDQ